MIHSSVTDEILEQSAAFALGAMAPEEARAFEAHLLGGCGPCNAEVRAFQDVAGALALAIPPVSLPPYLCARVLARAFADDRGVPAPTTEALPHYLHVTRAGAEGWQDGPAPHTKVKQLYVDRATKLVTMLIRGAPGARFPSHRHAATEQCLVLEGDLRSPGVVLRAGDFSCADGGSTHDDLWTEEGCLLLVVASADDELLV